MSKAPVDIIKYIIHADAEASGLVEKPDLIGAIFGQTEGLLGEDLDLRELQKSGRIGRIDADITSKSGVTKAHVMIPSSLDMVETSIIAAGVETITRIGPCDAKFKIARIEDVREEKRKAVVDRARDILKTFMSEGLPDSREISDGLREDIRVGDITTYKGLDAGSAVDSSESVIIVEGRADVLTLLRNGIKNAIAVGGIKIPKGIADITKNRTTTAFVDGDRGGDLILKSLKSAGTKIDYIARAPAGREVEGLARKEIIMALRRKKPAGEVLKELGVSEEKVSKRSPNRRETARTPNKKESVGTRSRSTRDGRSSPTERNRRSDSRSRISRTRSPRSDDRRGRSTQRDYVRRETGQTKEPSERATLLEKLDGLKSEAALLDADFKEIKKLKLDQLKKAKELKKANALVIDDIITKEVLELAKDCKYIAGITTAGNLSVPKSKIVVTKF